MKKSVLAVFSLILIFVLALEIRGEKRTPVTISGLILPRDSNGMFLENPDGQFEIIWSDKTEVALEANTRLISGLEPGLLKYRIQASKEVVEFPLPEGPATGIVEKRGGSHLEKALNEATNESWIEERGLKVYFGEAPEKEQLASENDPRFIGAWDGFSTPRTLSIAGNNYEVSLKKGGQTNALLYNVIGTSDCRPFINRATVTGRKTADGVISAEEIHLMPIGNQAATDDPNLPRYLFIGDSISGNYDKGLRTALAGKFNIHHPPANCGPTSKGCAHIVEWLGGYREEGRKWDVISFNFGHWDCGNDKATYQENLESIITELEKTEAELIWVTTCPVPRGFPKAEELDENGKAPGRCSGVMEKFINPWAQEVIERHPEISVCDHYQFVKEHETDLYADWWSTNNVHFNGEPAEALGKVLADHVLKVTGME